MRFVGAATVFTVLLTSVVGVSLPQGTRTSRIRGRIDAQSLSVVRGHLHPLARPQFDEGAVDSAAPMSRVTMVFKRTDTQQSALNALLQEQQDPRSANYHVWLTPEEFGDRFGLDPADVDTIVSWLQSQGFTVDDPPAGRSSVTFSGTAMQVNTALHTDIHSYMVNGVRHYAPASEPAIPAALAGVVSGFRGLHDFRMKSRARAGRADFTSSISGNHFLAPDDVATIYDFKTLYNSGLNGTGQSIAVMGQTDIMLSDISTFRQNANLPPNPPTVILVPGSGDPGISSGDLTEADLDVEWSGAMAPNATIIYVNSGNGAFDSLQYTIDHNLAPVVSISYGDCEANFAASDINSLTMLGQQANAQGMTIVAPAGDSGATDCDGDFPNRQVARLGLSVDFLASSPYATGVGATTLFDVNGNYWSPANNSNTGSALSYIPEVPWNDTLVFAAGGLFATGGGRSGLFSKPAWQVGPGVPNDGARDVPDVSLSGSDYDPYLICSAGSCVNGFRAADTTLNTVSGTSVATPIFAAMVTLLNQRMTTPQGNVNPGLYKLAQTTPSAFHDIDTGGNWMPCQPGTPNCPDGGLLGYSAGRGYDMVNGIGSIDASRIVTGWPITPQAATPQPAVPQAVATPRTGAQSTTPNAPAAAAAAPAPAAPPSPAVSLPIVALSRTSSPKPVIASVYGGGITWGSNSGNDGPFTQPVVITGTNLPENAAAYVNSPCENLGGRQALSTVWKNSGEIVANITIGCSGTYSIILIDPQSGEKLSAPATLVVPPAE